MEMMKAGGYTHTAIADINNTPACIEMMRLQANYGVQVVPGITFMNGDNLCYVCMARNNSGFAFLNEYLSDHLVNKRNFSDRMTYCKDVYVIYPVRKFPATAFENEYAGITPAEVPLTLVKKFANLKDRMIALPEFTMGVKEDYELHLLLRAISKNTLLSKLDTACCAPQEAVFMDRQSLVNAYTGSEYLLDRSQRLLTECEVVFDFSEGKKSGNQQTYTGSEEKDFALLKRLCRDGLPYRYPDARAEVLARVQKELDVIRQQNYVSYFLINYDITRYARSKGYFYVGRGSGANSVVAYLLRITDVDPMELDLYFERFINLYRKNPPDFDIDFSWCDRDDITRYIFERFRHVCLLGSFITFQFKAIVRELGKVFGMPSHEIDRLSERGTSLQNDDSLAASILKYASRLIDLPSHAGIHAAGILITEQPIYYYCAVFMPPKGFATTQIDMVQAEDVGLHKFDILSQRGLGKIKDTLQHVKDNGKGDMLCDIHNVVRFKNDDRVNAMLRDARAIGCFYVESPAMRVLLKKLRVDNYLGLVAASSVIRPGVARSGMMREFILRYRYPEKRKEAHPVMLELMPETFGVMVYQEDVIKVAHYFAGLSLGEADMLRRGMSGKYRSREEFEQVKQKFVSGAVALGRSPELAAEVWRQVESFAGYAFAKGHSASYAVESYQTLYLKCYFPLEYMVATLNNGGGFYSRDLYVLEAVLHGADIRRPCVNEGEEMCIIRDNQIILGMSFIKGIDYDLTVAVVSERKRNGKYDSLVNFTSRVRAGFEQVSLFIRAGSFNFTGVSSRTLLWEAAVLLNKGSRAEPTPGLFEVPVKSFTIPHFEVTAAELAYDALDLFGFIPGNPFFIYNTDRCYNLKASELAGMIGKEVSIYGYLIATKYTRTVKGDTMYFGTFVDREGTWIDTVHFAYSAAQFPFRGKGVYLITGKVMCEFDAITLDVTRMEKQEIAAALQIAV
jgi:DNA polymerase-3 subunit alpha